MKKPKLNFSILTYDIETSFLKANIWRPGEQVVRHDQLDPAFNMYTILTISYKWYGKKEVVTLIGNDAVEKFDVEVRKADVVIGKNNARFDNKYINTQRMLLGLQPLPEWVCTSEDLEQQLRKYFVFPSYSLDYISKLFGFGGKVKMEMQDWVDIANFELLAKFHCACFPATLHVLNSFCLTMFKKTRKEINKAGQKAWKKMIYYNKKDVRDTEDALMKVFPYVKLRHNAATCVEGRACTTCGSPSIIPSKIIVQGKTRYQLFYCSAHNGYGGKCTYKYDKNRNKVFGKMG